LEIGVACAGAQPVLFLASRRGVGYFLHMALTGKQLKELRSLSQKKFRDELGLFLVEGQRMIEEAAGSDFQFAGVYHTEEIAADPAVRNLLQKLRKRGEMHEVTAREIESFSDTVTAQGIAAVLRRRDFAPESLLSRRPERSVLVALDAVSDPGNVGSILRTCDWFGVNGVVLGRNSVDLYNPKVVRATMGGLFHLPIAERVDLPAWLSKAQGAGYTVYITDLEGEVHFDRVQYDNKSVIAFGNEAWGVSDQVKKLAQSRVVIRRYGAAESLNVGVACGIVLSSVHRLYE
jgi:TrmH family RNA methyltransferase